MPPAPRVLTITNMYPTPDQPASGSFIASQVESLRAVGVHTDVLHVDGMKSRWNYLKGLARVRDAIAEGSYDLIHAHYGLSGWVARFQTRLPLVVSFCGGDLLGSPRSPLIPRRTETRYPRTALSLAIVASSHALELASSALIVKSDEMRQRLFLPSSRRRAHVIPNGVDLSKMQAICSMEARAKLELRPGVKYVLFPHRATAVGKRLDLAAAAMERLKRRRTDVELLVVHQQSPALMPYYYAASNAMILTSESEGSPNVVKEALACQLPVVSVAAGDVQERIQGIPECELCPRDPDALARALDRVIDLPRSPRLREAVAELDLGIVARRIVNVYEEVLSARIASHPSNHQARR